MAAKVGSGAIKLDAICSKLSTGTTHPGNSAHGAPTRDVKEDNNNETGSSLWGAGWVDSDTEGDVDMMEQPAVMDLSSTPLNGVNKVTPPHSHLLDMSPLDLGRGQVKDYATTPSPVCHKQPPSSQSALSSCSQSAPSSSSRRKNKRKNFRPVNIAQFSKFSEGDDEMECDDLKEYHLNNPDVDFTRVCEDDHLNDTNDFTKVKDYGHLNDFTKVKDYGHLNDSNDFTKVKDDHLNITNDFTKDHLNNTDVDTSKEDHLNHSKDEPEEPEDYSMSSWHEKNKKNKVEEVEDAADDGDGDAPLELTNYSQRGVRPDPEPVDEVEEDDLISDDYGAIDLSFGRSPEGDTSMQAKPAKLTKYHPDPITTSRGDRGQPGRLEADCGPPAHQHPRVPLPVHPAGGVQAAVHRVPTRDASEPSVHRVPTRDASVIKDYAQSTVTELLSMYGVGDEATSITSKIPLERFDSDRILGPREPREKPRPHKSHVINPESSLAKALQSAHKRPVLNIPRSRDALPTTTDPSSMCSTPTSDHYDLDQSRSSSPESSEMQDAVYSKFVDNIAKLSRLPPGKQGSPGSFATSAAYIRACFDPNMGPKLAKAAAAASPDGKNVLPDYSKYIKRYFSHEDCSGGHCKDMGYREHYHCMDCGYRVFVKKEEMIRHFKWHKKRDESLQHGFMRYSPIDDCTEKFGPCTHNGRQTHYHCLQVRWGVCRPGHVQHGFMRYSPIDDSTEKFGPCTHNGRQTHYHCLQSGCSKVYISTSDVQMHANYHRKDSAIIQEGFQRFRATEDCGSPECQFYGDRTTHFHCRRSECAFTFKNKADMEKHKAYHQKDEVLSKDGFKKFMKYEHCNFPDCRYSKVSNHIHCIRPACNYVLHSTGQLYSHKRKHERRDFEHAYRRFKDDQTQKPMLNPAIRQMGVTPQGSSQLESHLVNDSGSTSRRRREDEYVDLEDLVKRQGDVKPDLDSLVKVKTEPGLSPEPDSPGLIPPPAHGMVDSVEAALLHSPHNKAAPSTLARLAHKLSGHGLSDSLNLPIPGQEGEDHDDTSAAEKTEVKPRLGNKHPLTAPSMTTPGKQEGKTYTPKVMKVSPPVNEKKERDESWKKYLTRYTANDPCHSRCQFLYKDHYHCDQVQCGMLFRSKDGVREHAKQHDQQDKVSMLSFMLYESTASCSQDSCHLSKKERHYHCLWADCKHVIAEKDTVFARLEHHKTHEFARSIRRSIPGTAKMDLTMRRRRGRPPKYPKDEIPNIPKLEMSEDEIAEALAQGKGDPEVLGNGFKLYEEGGPCPDDKCMFYTKAHYHCVRKKCHHSTDRLSLLTLHSKDFHNYINIMDGFEFFDRNINCRRPHCHNNKANRHFHCVRPRCDYSFVRYSTMEQHDQKHRMAEMGLTHSPSIAIPKASLIPQKPRPGQVPIAPMPIAGQVILGSQQAGGQVILGGATTKPSQVLSGTSQSSAGQMLIGSPAVVSAGGQVLGGSTGGQVISGSTGSQVIGGHSAQTAGQILLGSPAQSTANQVLLGSPVTSVGQVLIGGGATGASQMMVGASPGLSNQVVKSTGTFFPMTTMAGSLGQVVVGTTPSSVVVALSPGATMASPGMINPLTSTGMVAPIIIQPLASECLPASSIAQPLYSTQVATSSAITGLSAASTLSGLVQAPSTLSGLVQAPSTLSGLVQAPSTLSGLVQAQSLQGLMQSNLLSGLNAPFTSSPLPGIIQSAESVMPISTGMFTTSTGVSNLIEIAPKPAQDDTSVKDSDTGDDGAAINALPHHKGNQDVDDGPALSTLLQQKAQNQLPQLNWLDIKMRMHYGIQENCARPFCKLKRKDHYHCFECHQAFAEASRLKGHIMKHGTKLDNTDCEAEADSTSNSPLPSHGSDQNDTTDDDMTDKDSMIDDDDSQGQLVIDLSQVNSQASNAHCESQGWSDDRMEGEETSHKSIQRDEASQMSSDGSQQSDKMRDSVSGSDGKTATDDDNSKVAARRSSRKRTATRHDGFIDTDMVVTPKSSRLTSPRSVRDDSIPDGSTKYKWTEDCELERCAYRLNQTHYHCLQDPCGYAFTDRSRFSQHLERHKKQEILMGKEFQVFRGNAECRREDCEYTSRSTHYHCLKCPFICTDSSKVVPHRKHHAKTDVLGTRTDMLATGEGGIHKDKTDMMGDDRKQHAKTDVLGARTDMATGDGSIHHAKTDMGGGDGKNTPPLSTYVGGSRMNTLPFSTGTTVSSGDSPSFSPGLNAGGGGDNTTFPAENLSLKASDMLTSDAHPGRQTSDNLMGTTSGDNIDSAFKMSNPGLHTTDVAPPVDLSVQQSGQSSKADLLRAGILPCNYGDCEYGGSQPHYHCEKEVCGHVASTQIDMVNHLRKHTMLA